MNKIKQKTFEKPIHDMARATAVKKIAIQFKVTDTHVREIVRNGAKTLAGEKILKAYKIKYAELNKIINS